MDAKRLDLEAIQKRYDKATRLATENADRDLCHIAAAHSATDVPALIEALEAAWAENERLRGAVDSAGADIDWLRKRISGFKLLLSEHHNPTGIMRLIASDPGDNCPICRDHWPQEAPNSSG